MIMTLDEAQLANPDITQAQLDAFEVMVRNYTHNHFQVKGARFYGLEFTTTGIVNQAPSWLAVNDTIEISETLFNNGVYTVSAITDTEITLNGSNELRPETADKAYASLVRYPADIAQGILKLIKYDYKMGDKIGVKMESISRMRTDYYDISTGENAEGYPKALIAFLTKYEKIQWGN